MPDRETKPQRANPHDTLPGPMSAGDPTERTRQDLMREVDSLRREAGNLKELMDTKIQAHADVNRALIDSNQRIADVIEKAFRNQFETAESQRLEQKADTKQAVVDALAAAKEAVTITANNTKEQILALQTSFGTKVDAMAEKVDDLKNTVLSNSSAIAGERVGKTQMSDSLKLGIAIIGSVILMIGFFLALRGAG